MIRKSKNDWFNILHLISFETDLTSWSPNSDGLVLQSQHDQLVASYRMKGSHGELNASWKVNEVEYYTVWCGATWFVNGAC